MGAVNEAERIIARGRAGELAWERERQEVLNPTPNPLNLRPQCERQEVLNLTLQSANTDARTFGGQILHGCLRLCILWVRVR